jgi:tetratricopeptide (TPR) repeat protein
VTLWARLLGSRWARLGLQAGAVVTALGLVGAGVWGWQRAQESRSVSALAAATALLPAEGQPLTPELRERAIKAFEGVLADYPRQSTASQAAYELGNLKYAAGRYEEARSAYTVAAGKDASGTAGTLASIGIGYAWEAEKNYAEAAAAYQAAVKRLGPKDFLFEEALMAEARTQELAGKPAAAVDLYQRLLREAPDARRAEDLRGRLASLKSRAQPSQPTK